MGRPLPQLLVFLAICFVLVSLAQGVPLPGEHQNVTVSGENREVRGEPERPESSKGLSGLAFRSTCVLSLGLAEIPADACSQGFEGTFVEDWANVEIVRTVTGGLSDFIGLIGAVMTFNVPGAPAWVRWAVGMPIAGTTMYIVVSLVRGVG
jgi:hypothetical protein